MKRLIISFFSFTTISLSQPDTLWTKTFSLGHSIGRSVQQVTDGGYIITGQTYNNRNDNSDIWLIKTDSEGNEEWNQTFGGSNNDYGYSLQQTTDGGYIILGTLLIKTDSEGNEEWEKNIIGKSVQQTTDGGYIIIGGAPNIELLKTDTNGDTLWAQTFGGSANDVGESVQQTTDGGYIITGHTESYGNGQADIWLIKTDSLGQEDWNQTLGGSLRDAGYSVQHTNDGGYIIVGQTSSFGNGKVDTQADVWLIKINSLGQEEWNQTYGSVDTTEVGYSVQQTMDGGYIITGSIESAGIPYDVYLIKADSNGNEQWTQTYGGSSPDEGFSVLQTTDGGYIITGYSDSFGSLRVVWLIKIDSEGFVQISSTFSSPKSFNLSQNYPNPFNPITTLRYDLPQTDLVTITIYDMLGRQVKPLINQTQDAGYRSVIWDATNDYGKPVSAGIYLYKIQAGEYMQIKKMVLLK